MAYYVREFSSNTVRIIRAESAETCTNYIIEVQVGTCCWTVSHRYSDFYKLNEQLVAEFSVDKKLLPPKKVIGNTSESFIQKRRLALENYLQSVLILFDQLPYSLAVFLDFQKYENNCITQVLAEMLFQRGEMLLTNGSTCTMDPLQLHAITERLLRPETVAVSSSARDFGHILDFITRLERLRVVGTDRCVGTSNINMNALDYSLAKFKNLKYLELVNCNISKVKGLDMIRNTLEKLKMKKSVSSIQAVVTQDTLCWDQEGHGHNMCSGLVWPYLHWLDLSENSIAGLDESVRYLEKVAYLDLHDNYIESIEHLSHLSCLTHLDLSNNRIKRLSDLHLALGNIQSINISGNQVETLEGFRRLYSLEYLDVSNNKISQVAELMYLSSLPLLEQLVLIGNPVTVKPDYRIQILKIFGDRAKEICLDNTRATEKELDTVAVLMALDHAKLRTGSSPALQRVPCTSVAEGRSSSSFDTGRATEAASPQVGQQGLPQGHAANAHWLTILDQEAAQLDLHPKDQTGQQSANQNDHEPACSDSYSPTSFHSIVSTDSYSTSDRCLATECIATRATDYRSESGDHLKPSVDCLISRGDNMTPAIKHIPRDDHMSPTIDHVTPSDATPAMYHMTQNTQIETVGRTSGLSIELVDHLGRCIAEIPLSVQLQDYNPLLRFQMMDGEDLFNFFFDVHSMRRCAGNEEELSHALWTNLLHYNDPVREQPCLILLSSAATYFIHMGSDDNLMIELLEHSRLTEIVVGIDQQTVRLAADSENLVFCCVTRNQQMVQHFVDQLSTILSLNFKSEQIISTDLDDSIYDRYSRKDDHATERIGHVEVIRCGAAALRDLSAILSHENKLLCGSEVTLSRYVHVLDATGAKPITLTLGKACLFLMHENYVSFPLPRCATALPAVPQYEVVRLILFTDVKEIRHNTNRLQVELCVQQGSNHTETLLFQFSERELLETFVDSLPCDVSVI